jgi:NADH:ubiquinone oxidoreductase subunit E
MAIDMERAETLVEKFRHEDAGLIELLLDVQDEFNYVPEKVLVMCSEKLGIPLERLLGVATFYNAFTTTPKGRNHVKVCTGTACIVRGSRSIFETVIEELGVEPGETTEDGAFSLENVHCLGACALGPIVVVNDEYHGHMTTKKTSEVIKKVKAKAQEETEEVAQ